MDALEYRTEQVPAATVIRLAGDVDLSNANILKHELERQRVSGNHLILDLGGVTYLDMSGVRVFEGIRAACEAQGRLLILTSPSLLLRRLFHVIELERRITIFDSREQALAHLQ